MALLLASPLVVMSLACGGDRSEPTTTSTSEAVTTSIAPAVWRSVATNGTPPSGRQGATLIALPSDNRLLLFGGRTADAVCSNGTWLFDPATSTWHEIITPGLLPAPRAAHALVPDPVSGEVILFGGFDGVSYYNDTWAYDLAANAWSNLQPTGSVPAKRAGHSLVYDPVSKRMILFGGWNGTVGYNDTWAYDPAANAWTNLRPSGSRPAARDSHGMSYDPVSKLMVLFGGWNATAEFRDTWAYDPARGTWIDLAPAGEVPSNRAMQQMVYDPRVERLMMFGGGSGTKVLEDTWQFDVAAKSWRVATLTGNSPPARTGYALVYDPTTQRILMFGGFDGRAFFNDLWILAR